MTPIRYSYAYVFEMGWPSDDVVTGDLQLIRDLERKITEKLGDPAYKKNDPAALDDPRNVVVCINSSLHPAIAPERAVNIYAPNDHYGTGARGCSIVLKPSFNDASFFRRGDIKPDTVVLPVHAFPARTTPEAIACAASSYHPVHDKTGLSRWDKLRCSWYDYRKPSDAITTFVIGDLSWNNWNPKPIIKAMASLMKKRGGRALVTTSHRTQEQDEKALVSALKPWLAHLYSWREVKKTGEPNPYLAMLGAASEICVTGDSLSMISDVLETKKPFRLAFGAKTEYGDPYPEDRLVNNLIDKGAQTLRSSSQIIPPPDFDTGVPQAVEAICTIIRQKASKLGL